MNESDRPRRAGDDLTQWRLGELESDVDTIKTTYATKEQHDDLKRIVYAVFTTAGGAIAIIFANSFHLFSK